MKKTAEFKAGDIFRLVNPKGKLTTRQLIDGTDYPYVAAKKTENGIPKWCSAENIPEDQVMPGKCIVFVQQGDGAAGYATYQPLPFYAISCVCCGYIDNIDMTDEIGIYLMACLCKNKAFYSHSQSWSTAKIMDTPMILPVIENSDPYHVYTPDDIDWAYMEEHIRRLEEEHIRRLEEEHIRRLEEYLRVAGFESTILTPEEQEVLRKFRTGGVIFRKYRICDLFEIRKVYGKPIKAYSSGTIPYISGARDNNGCIGFVSAPDDAISEGNCISVDPITGASRYQPEKFVGRGFSGASVNTLYNQNINPKNALYLCGAIEKMASGVASYSHLLNGKKLANAEISLPCLPSGTPDYALMEVYIRALEKQSISRLDTMQKEEEKITKKITKKR